MPSTSAAVPAGRPRGGPVHVRAHIRDGGKVQVDAYDRAAPPSSPAAEREQPAGDAVANREHDSLPSVEVVEEELLKALRIEAGQRAEPGPIRRIVLDAQAATIKIDRDRAGRPVFVPQRVTWTDVD